MCGQGGMGPVPLSSAEVMAWQHGMGLSLAPWEFRVLRAASRAFVAEVNAEADYPPYGDPDELSDPDVIDEKLSRMLDRLATPLDKR